jgi:DNA-directed RNA polymerase
MEIEPAEDGMDIYEYVAYNWKGILPDEYKKYGVRKAAKKPVMTFAYSATRHSAMDYIATLYEELDRSIACKLGSSLFDMSNKILEPMVEGVDWLKECVKIISAKGHTDIQWVTPDGFIAIQSKFQTEYTETKVVIKRKAHAVKCKDPIYVDGKPIPNIRKAQLSIGPNFIHSLDATHLRMVATRLEHMGIPAIWVHDSFAVHANYIDLLDKVIRQEFIAMYSKDIMNEIRDYWMEFYKVDLPEAPKLGKWNVDKIEFCPKFFS